MNEHYIKRENVLNSGVLKQNPTTDAEKNPIKKFPPGEGGTAVGEFIRL